MNMVKPVNNPMENANRIYRDPRYAALLTRLNDLEKERVYCKHDLDHFLSVGRIAYILSLEEGLSVSKDVLYTAALLHDIGRVEEITSGMAHAEASAKIAEPFLANSTFTKDEKETVLSLIRSHRTHGKDSLTELFYRADKLSRPCAYCAAISSCHWQEDKKNRTLHY